MTKPAGPRPEDSRLARMIERMLTQRACLEWAIREVDALPGPLLEVGLGKGRTYDHLRRLAPNREIYCFDRDVHATPDCVPDSQHLELGDFRATLPRAVSRIGGSAALVHADVGSDDGERDARLTREIAPMIASLLRPGGLLITDRAMESTAWIARALPESVGRWEYFIYQRR